LAQAGPAAAFSFRAVPVGARAQVAPQLAGHDFKPQRAAIFFTRMDQRSARFLDLIEGLIRDGQVRFVGAFKTKQIVALVG
jgi:hypothetical protein